MLVISGFLVSLDAAELPVRIQYPTQVNDVILTGVDGDSLVFRPKGRDKGGRAYLKLDDLLQQGVVLDFLFPKSYYDAVAALDAGQTREALPVLKREVAPFLDYLSLSEIPGNMLPTVLSYLEALRASKQWTAATDVATRIPVAIAPVLTLDQLRSLSLELLAADETTELARLQRHLLNARHLSQDHLEVYLRLADDWREAGEYVRAYELYRKVQVQEGPNQIQARLWVAYCSFYLGHDLVPQVFLDELPEMDVNTAGYSLRELIKARLAIRDGAIAAAMRSAAEGKTYAVATDPWYPELLYTVAVLYGEMGMHEAAIAAHREVSILFSETPWATQSLKALEITTPEVSTL
jgi:tetratricopeptide (TPR) repeat protein